MGNIATLSQFVNKRTNKFCFAVFIRLMGFKKNRFAINETCTTSLVLYAMLGHKN